MTASTTATGRSTCARACMVGAISVLPLALPIDAARGRPRGDRSAAPDVRARHAEGVQARHPVAPPAPPPAVSAMTSCWKHAYGMTPHRSWMKCVAPAGDILCNGRKSAMKTTAASLWHQPKALRRHLVHFAARGWNYPATTITHRLQSFLASRRSDLRSGSTIKSFCCASHVRNASTDFRSTSDARGATRPEKSLSESVKSRTSR